MRSFLDAKLMAKTLRQSLAKRKVDLSRSECLELVAQQYGLVNWNILAANIGNAMNGGIDLKIPNGWRIWADTDQRLFRLGLHPVDQGTIVIENRFIREGGIDISGTNIGTLGQIILTQNYHKRRIKLSANLKTEDAEHAALWMRVFSQDGTQLCADLMRQGHIEGALTGTITWTKRTIVLDVPDKAHQINFGIYLQNYGHLQARDVGVEVVGNDIALTTSQQFPTAPVNLGFAA